MGKRKGKSKEVKDPCQALQAAQEKSKLQPVDPDPVKHFPIFAITLTVLQVIYHFYLWDVIPPELLYFNYAERYQLWRYFTVAFVHDETEHFIRYGWYFLVYGIYMELTHGWMRVLVIFFGGIAVTELAIPLILGPTDLVDGCTCGVFALISANVICAILNPHLITGRVSPLFLYSSILHSVSEPLQCKIFQLVSEHCKLPNSGFGFSLEACEMTESLFWNEYTSVSVYYHGVGVVTGIVVGAAVLKITGEQKAWKVKIQSWASTLSAVTVGYLVIRNIF